MIDTACFHCGEYQPSGLVEIRAWSLGKQPLFLCSDCYSDYTKKYFTIATCHSCGLPYTTEEDEPPYECKVCSQFSKSLIGASEADLEDYERHGYLGKTSYKDTSPMCLRKALNLYVDARKNENSGIRRDRAITFFKVSRGLPDNSLVIGLMSQTAKDLKIKPHDLFEKLANQDRAEEGLQEIVALYKELGWKAVDAVDDDWQEMELGNKPKHFSAFMADNPHTLCLEKEDDFSNLPF